MQVSLAWFKKDIPGPDRVGTAKWTKSQRAHLYAFFMSLSNCNKYLKDYLSDDIADIVAEDSHEMGKWLRQAPQFIKQLRENGISEFDELTNIADGIRPAKKGEAPLL